MVVVIPSCTVESSVISEFLDSPKSPVLSRHEIAFLSFGWNELDSFSAAQRPQLLSLGFCQEGGGSRNVEPGGLGCN